MTRLVIFLICSFATTSLLATINPPEKYTYSELQAKIEYSIEKKETDSLAYFYEYLADKQSYKYQHEEALEAYEKSIKCFLVKDDSLNYYRVNLKKTEAFKTEIDIYVVLYDYQQALQYYNRTKKNKEAAHVYAKLSIWYKEQNNVEDQNYHINECIKLNQIAKDTLLDIVINFEKAELDQSLDYYTKSLKATETSLELSEATNNKKYIGLNKMRKGILLNFLKRHEEAEDFLTESEYLLKNLGEPSLLLDLYEQAAANYAAMDEHKPAYDYLQSFNQLQDSLHQVQRKAEIDKLLAKNKMIEKEAELAQLKEEKIKDEVQIDKKSTLLNSFYFAGLLTLIGIYFMIRFFQQQIQIKEMIALKNGEINRQKIVELENNLKIETMHSMLSGQEVERERVAKDLHDSLGGLLSTVKLQFESVQTQVSELMNIRGYQKATQLLDEACQEVRNISNNMQPGALNKLGLVAAVKDLTNRFLGKHYPEIDFQHYGINTKLESTVSLMVYRIIQELLHNSIKHAEANEIIIQLTKQDQELIIMVEDDGKGYDPQQSKKGMGTGNIASRVNYLKGDLSIHSIKNQGTSTMITVPLEA